MSKAVRVFHEKVRTAEGVIVESKIWRVPKSESYPDGVKYSFFAVYGGRVLVGYDNHAPKGYHRHFRGVEESYSFRDFDNLKTDFARDLAEALKEIRTNGSKNDSN